MAYEGFAYCYDRLMSEMPYPRWIAFAEEVWARTQRPSLVADIGCGTGNIAIPLALKGYSIVGIDRSDDMLSVARDKWDEARDKQPFPVKGSVRWLHQDAVGWDGGEEMDACISFCDTLNYLVREQALEETFRCTYRALKTGGTFLFDMLTARQFASYDRDQPYIYRDDQTAYLWTCAYDEEHLEIEHDLTIFHRMPDSTGYRRVDETHHQRAYSKEWLLDMLARTGFRQADVYGDFTFQPADDETLRYFICAVK